MPLADALSFFPGLATAPAEPAEDAATLRRLAEWCGRYSPWTAPDGTDGVRVEITGSAHLWGGEAALAADLMTRRDCRGIAGLIAIADTLGAAWAMARFAEMGRGPVILPPGDCRTALAPLPVEALRLDPAITQGLRRVGLKRIGDLYAMPRHALAQRFGETLAQRLDQALDNMPEPLSPLGETPTRRVRLSFAEPIEKWGDAIRLIAGQVAGETDLLGRQGLYRKDGEDHVLNAEPGIDGVEPPLEEGREVARLAARTSGAEPDPLDPAIDAVEGEIEPPGADPLKRQAGDEIGDEPFGREQQIGGLGNRLGKA